MRTLPENVTPTNRTPTFDKTSVPKGMLKKHAAKLDTWAMLTGEEGEILNVITEPGFEEEMTVNPGTPGVIVPEQKHHVRLTGDVRFHIQFYR